ncbi:MAG: NAD-dependent DNA ligase LigA, partial [Elusimicrobia bacterium]|nr:NAD-dependent DNA ligase LigA [Elusimicrobiota bacterium]
MKKNEHEKEIRRLRAEIEKHNHLYYSEGRPEISDADYDVLFRNLKRLEDKYPELMLDDSPTLKVGSSPSTERGTLKHLKPMLSLDNTYSDAEIRSWIERITKTIGNSSGFIVEDKIDGVGISLLYEEGVLSRAATRGNGIEGEDITANIMTQKLIPRRLKGSSIPPIIEIRGEIFITHSELERINIKREASGEKPFSNPRNTCAGTLKLLDPNLVAERKMTAFFYAYGGREGGELPDRQKQLLETFSRWGL